MARTSRSASSVANSSGSLRPERRSHRIALARADQRHLGDVVLVFDGDGFVWLAHIETVAWITWPLTCDPDLIPRPPTSCAAPRPSLGVLQHSRAPIAADDLSRQTPCADFDVAQLTEHLLNSIIGPRSARSGADLPPRDADDIVERQIIAAARPALDAWHRHGLDGDVTLARQRDARQPLAAASCRSNSSCTAGITPRPPGTDVDAPDSLAEYVLGLAEKIITPERRATGSSTTRSRSPADAGALDQLVAFTGRDPAAAATRV